MDQFDGRVDVEFFHDIRPVGFDRADADTEHIGNLTGALPLGYQLEYFPFPVGELFVPLRMGGAFPGRAVGFHQHL